MDFITFIEYKKNTVDKSSNLISETDLRELQSKYSLGIGPQLQYYLLNYGYLGYKSKEFYGINSKQKENSDMIVATNYLRLGYGISNNYIPFAHPMPDKYILVDSSDRMYIYKVIKEIIVPLQINNKKIELFEYIRNEMQIEDCVDRSTSVQYGNLAIEIIELHKKRCQDNKTYEIPERIDTILPLIIDKVLNGSEKECVYEYYINHKRYSQIARKRGTTRERPRQIISEALRKLSECEFYPMIIYGFEAYKIMARNSSEKEVYLSVPISILKIKKAKLKRLRAIGFNTIGDLNKKNIKEILSYDSIGYKTVDDVIYELSDLKMLTRGNPIINVDKESIEEIKKRVKLI